MVGLVLVLITLAVFLDLRAAFWVAVGVPVSILGCLAILWLAGGTLNMVSVFSLIMMIGIIVDDAIVVGEQVASESARGVASDVASIRGAQRMVIPVMAATLTTAAAFAPIFAVTGPIGQVMGVIPMVALAVLVASTIECFLVLPAHLSHGGRKPAAPSAFRRRFDAGFAAFRDGPYLRALTVLVAWRYAFCAFLVGTLLVFAGLLMGNVFALTFSSRPRPRSCARVSCSSPACHSRRRPKLSR